jgi:hypothetical protein
MAREAEGVEAFAVLNRNTLRCAHIVFQPLFSKAFKVSFAAGIPFLLNFCEEDRKLFVGFLLFALMVLIIFSVARVMLFDIENGIYPTKCKLYKSEYFLIPIAAIRST